MTAPRAPLVAAPSASEIAHAAARLEAGELVAFPTETVYGLGGDAENAQAIARIYAAKGRPANHPVIVQLSPTADPAYWVRELTPDAQKLIAAFWPGPLTLILKRAAHIPEAVSGGQDSVGLRCPSHPVAQALLEAFKGGKGGVAAPSANRFGRVSPTTAQHVREEFGEAVEVLDGGAWCEVGIESTIVDLSRGFAALLRPGHVSAQCRSQTCSAWRRACPMAAMRRRRVRRARSKRITRRTRHLPCLASKRLRRRWHRCNRANVWLWLRVRPARRIWRIYRAYSLSRRPIIRCITRATCTVCCADWIAHRCNVFSSSVCRLALNGRQ